MKNQAWDKLSVCFEDARISGRSEFHWPSFTDQRFRVTVEYNGGLPILDLKDLRENSFKPDLTALAALRILEEVSQ